MHRPDARRAANIVLLVMVGVTLMATIRNWNQPEDPLLRQDRASRTGHLRSGVDHLM